MTEHDINDLYGTILDRLESVRIEQQHLAEETQRVGEYHQQTIELIRQLLFAVSGQEIDGP